MDGTLEPGAALALHAVRRAALKDGTICPVRTEKVINAQLSMRAFSDLLLYAGRKLNLGEIGTLDPTPDERSLLNVLSAAQNEDEEKTIAALRWLIGREPEEKIINAAKMAASAFADVGWKWGAPQATRGKEPPFGMLPVRIVE